ncbi:winged helix-turn-helix domain-containing protein [Sphingomonas astaxanthinifaciens]|uniref:OmpR/PhoB-type domain-containing protein n=1 Tax=Sphingomonas astaxanthinifaciens DSM 22298 TaxID=1123267 RepID=A0ABQ5Z691_9SPHN|nr:winged helix-turn-helix domain-containing protein [Sphingomonas astaxanthinifaciens]GLR46413.1 hypothetical protein GCM10007925_01240 [Sphingomonas astaxanthinifaciens DSM 22298]
MDARTAARLPCPIQPEPPFRAGRATIDPATREAHFPGGCERLQPQNLKVLAALCAHRGQLVSRAELVERCWDGRIVGDDVINRSISMLRAFAERVGGFTIETVPKAGYRLVEEKPPRRSRTPLILGGLILVLAALAAWWFWPHRRTDPTAPVVALRAFTSNGERDSADLAAATTGALSTMLVAGSFHGQLLAPAGPGDEARSDLVIAGDVRRTGAAFVATVQVRDRRSGTLMFSRRYEAPAKTADLLPEQVGAEIASNLTGALALMVLDRRTSESPGFTAEKLKQIAITVANQDPLGAYRIAQRMAETQPNSLMTQLALAFDTSFALPAIPREERAEAVRRARLAADRGLRMAPDFGDTHAPWCFLHPSTFARGCEDRLRAGLRADPDAPFVPVFLSSLLFDSGRFEESSQFARLGLASDPFHPQKLRRVIRTAIVLGHTDEAAQTFAKAVRWWPRHSGIYADRLLGFALRGDLPGGEQALAEVPDGVFDATRMRLGAMFAAYRAGNMVRLRPLCLDPEGAYLLANFCLTALHLLRDDRSAAAVADRLFVRVTAPTPAAEEALWLDDPDLGMEPMLAAPAAAWLRADPRFFSWAERTGALLYWGRDRLPDFCRPPGEPVCGKLGRAGA